MVHDFIPIISHLRGANTARKYTITLFFHHRAFGDQSLGRKPSVSSPLRLTTRWARVSRGFIGNAKAQPTIRADPRAREVSDGAIGGNPSPRNGPDDIIDGFEMRWYSFAMDWQTTVNSKSQASNSK